MALDTTTGSPILTPEQVGALVVQPVQQMSVAMRASTVVATSAHSFRIPVVTADPTADWTPEGAEIAPSDQAYDEVTVVPRKLAGLSIISRELADDSSPQAAATVGQGLARDIAKKVDQAFFGSPASAEAPAGLDDQTGLSVVEDTSVSPAVAYQLADLDQLAEAISVAEQAGAEITSFVTSPALALALSRLKTESASNEPLLGRDATAAGDRTALGVPVRVSEYVAADTIWALPAAYSWVVMRNDTTLDVDRSAYFSSDRVGIRATMRVGFAWPHPTSVVRIRVTA